MSRILERLRADHERLNKVLGELTTAVREAAAGDSTAEDRFFCMVDYLHAYPHEIHHPVEDVVFSRLLATKPEMEQAQTIRENAAQHSTLESETKALIHALEAGTPDFNALEEMIVGYVDHQRRHMQHEERVVFPLLLAVFSESDWNLVEDQIDKLEDPLFDKAEARFSAIYDCLGIDPANPILARGAESVSRFLDSTAEDASDR